MAPAAVATPASKVYPVTLEAVAVTPDAKSNPVMSGMVSFEFEAAAGIRTWKKPAPTADAVLKVI